VQSSHWNNGKMKIVYNTAYVQIETFDFTFAPKAIIVHGCLCANFQEITMPRMPNIKVQSKQVEPSRADSESHSARLGVCVVCVVCCAAAKMTTSCSYLLLRPSRHVACVVFIHSFVHFFKINNDKTHCCDNRGTPRKMQSK